MKDNDTAGEAAQLEAAFQRAAAEVEREEPGRRARIAAARAATTQKLNATAAEMDRATRRKGDLTNAAAVLLQAEADFPMRRAKAAARHAEEARAEAERAEERARREDTPERREAAEIARKEAENAEKEAASLEAIQRAKARLITKAIMPTRHRGKNTPTKLLRAIWKIASTHPRATAEKFLDFCLAGDGEGITAADRKVLLDAIADGTLKETNATAMRHKAAQEAKRRHPKPSA